MPATRARWLFSMVLGAVGLAACGDSGDDESGCGGDIQVQVAVAQLADVTLDVTVTTPSCSRSGQARTGPYANWFKFMSGVKPGDTVTLEVDGGEPVTCTVHERVGDTLYYVRFNVGASPSACDCGFTEYAFTDTCEDD